MKNVAEIVEKWLRENGYDGLYHCSMCGCHVDDLMPCCGDSINRCQPGIEMVCDCGEDCDFHIGPKKKGGEE